MKTLEQKLTNSVDVFANNISKILIAGKGGSSLTYVVQRQWAAAMEENSLTLSEFQPVSANAVADLRQKVIELAPDFIQRYQQLIKQPQGMQRILRPIFENKIQKAVVGLIAAAVTYGALVFSADYRNSLDGNLPALTGGGIFLGGLLMIMAIQEYAMGPTRAAREERRNFEEVIKSEYYRAVQPLITSSQRQSS